MTPCHPRECPALGHSMSPSACAEFLLPSRRCEDGAARPLIQSICFKFHANAMPRFKGVLQHQVLGLGIDRGPLPRWCDPSRTDFRAPVDAVDIHEACGADY